MMRRFLFVDILITLAGLIGADPVPPAPAQPNIVFPKKTKPDVQPLPDAPYVLSKGTIYVIDCKVDCILRAHPAHLVEVKKLKGPRDITAKFSDGSGEEEDRTFAGPFIFRLKAVGTGTVEVDVIPIGAKDESEIKTATIQVDAGHGPQPPPGPGPGPGPKPPDPAPVVVKSFKVILVNESGDTMTAAQSGVFYGNVVEDFLNKTCTGGNKGWRRRDKDADGTNDPDFAAMWNAVKPKVTSVPCVAVAVNEKVDIVPLEATPDAMVKVLTKYAEGK